MNNKTDGQIPITVAADILGVTRMTVYNWLNKDHTMADTSPASIRARADEIEREAIEIRRRLNTYLSSAD